MSKSKLFKTFWMAQVRRIVPSYATMRIMEPVGNSDMPGLVYQWEAPNGQIMQFEIAGPNPNAPPTSNAGSGSTVHISILKTVNGKLVPNKYTGLPEREQELDGETGEWVSEALANPRSSEAVESIVNGVHITSGVFTKGDMLYYAQSRKLTTNKLAYGTSDGSIADGSPNVEPGAAGDGNNEFNGDGGDE